MQNKEEITSSGSSEKLKGIDNLEGFLNNLCIKIVILLRRDVKNFTSLMNEAKERYENPSSMKWVVSGITRVKGPEIAQTIENIEKSQHIYEQITHLQKLIQDGTWYSGSYNTYLIDKIIQKEMSNHYEPMKNYWSVALGDRAKKLFPPIIETAAATVIEKERKDKELEEVKNLNCLKNRVEEECIFKETLEETKQSVLQQPDKIHFSLFLSPKGWKLYWVDCLGKEYELLLRENLEKILNSPNIKGIKDLNFIQKGFMRSDSMMARELILNSIQVLLNPEQTDEALLSSKVTSTFIIRSSVDNMMLQWIDSFGSIRAISLKQYPALEELLKDKELAKLDVSQIKMHLLHVDVAKVLDRDDFKNHLITMFAKQGKLKPQVTVGRLVLGQGLVNHLESILMHRVSHRSVGTLNMSHYINVIRMFGAKLPDKEKEELVYHSEQPSSCSN